MFTEFNSKTPFSKLRFVVDSLVAPLGGGGGAARCEEEMPLRFGLPFDPLLEGELKRAAVPSGMLNRLHALVDELADESAA